MVRRVLGSAAAEPAFVPEGPTRHPPNKEPERGDGPSPPLLAVDRKGQGDVERVVVLDQRRVLVVENQLLQRPVQVVGLSEPKAGAGLVDDAMFDLSVHPERENS